MFAPLTTLTQITNIPLVMRAPFNAIIQHSRGSQAEREPLQEIRAKGGTWAVYQNQDPEHHNFLHLAFMRYGDGTPFTAPPRTYPSDKNPTMGPGRRYLHVGCLDLNTGEIVEEEPASVLAA